MADSSRALSGDELRQRVIAAAVCHLESGGIERFEYRFIASRAGLDARLLAEIWPDRGALLTAVWAARLGWNCCLSDTGSLNGDLQRFSEAITASVQTPEGRMLLRSSLPIDEKQQFAEVQANFWRTQFDAAAAMMHRAQQRGELRNGIDPLDAARSFCTSLYFGPLYFDEAVGPGYVDSAVDIFLCGVAKIPTGDSCEIREQVMARVGTGERDLLGEERAAVDYPAATTSQVKDVILDAAIKEATLRGTEHVAMDAIARRAGVTVHVINRYWNSDDDLLREAGDRARKKTRRVPDTGSLSGDLVRFTEDKAKLVSTVDARRNFLSTILRNSVGIKTALVADFWARGLQESTQMLLRAEERGELREVVSPDHATRVVVVSLYFDLFFANSPMRPDYAAQTLDIFLNGATG